MKKSILTMILLTITVAQAQPPNVSFRMGFPISTMQFMFAEKSGVVPTAGLGYFVLRNSSSYRDDYGSDSFSLTVQYFVPNVGLRRNYEPIGNLGYYALMEVFLGIPTVSGTDMTDHQKKNTRDQLGLAGVTIGWGVEYLVSEQFSVGSEVSFSAVRNSSKYESEYDNYTRESSTILGGTLCRLTLNYYFN